MPIVLKVEVIATQQMMLQRTAAGTKIFLLFAIMFTGIIEAVGRITSIESNGTNKSFWIESVISDELKVEQSLSHEGVCLTVEVIKDGKHRVTAIEETLKKTNLNNWNEGRLVNIYNSIFFAKGQRHYCFIVIQHKPGPVICHCIKVK